MSIFAISDLHLAFGVKEKSMEVFGPAWSHYQERIKDHWHEIVQARDLVLIPGDISWAMKLEEAMIDLEWIHALPGTKLILKGNHDYWWPSAAKLQKSLPDSIHFIQNNAFDWNEFSFAGSRLWDSPEYDFEAICKLEEKSYGSKVDVSNMKDISSKNRTFSLEDEKLFLRELERLELSLKCLNPNAKRRVALVHYPPIGLDLIPSKTHDLLEKYHVELCVFGHLHGIDPEKELFGRLGHVLYKLTSSDYLQFKPLKLF